MLAFLLAHSNFLTFFSIPSETTSPGIRQKRSCDDAESADQSEESITKKSKSRAKHHRDYRARQSFRDSTKLNKHIGVEYQRKYPYFNKTTDEYNFTVLPRVDNQINSNAIDFIPGCQDEEHCEDSQSAFENKKLMADTCVLLKNFTLLVDQHYIITANIDVVDGLTNGAIGKLVHVKRNENGEATRMWSLLPTPNRKIGLKTRNNARAFIIGNKVNSNAVSISRPNAKIYHNRKKTISVKTKHFPLVAAYGVTIYESQGRTFDEVVHYYERVQSEQSVYTTMSHTTSIEELYIISVYKKRRSYYGRSANKISCLSLRLERIRLRVDPHFILKQELLDFLNSRQCLSVVSLNCQSLNAYANDLTHRVVRCSNIIILSESFTDGNELPVPLPNFDFVVRFQRQEKRNSGVVIYHGRNNHCYVVTPHLEIQVPYTGVDEVTVSRSARIGDLCAIKCGMTHDPRYKLILIAVYISPNTSMENIKLFIAKALLSLSNEGSKLLARMLGKPVQNSNQAVILAGDFNVNFSLPQAEPLLTFLEEHFSLRMINGRNDPTTKGGTTIDAVFARNLDNVPLKHFVSYFSYHNPIVTTVDLADSESNNKHTETQQE